MDGPSLIASRRKSRLANESGEAGGAGEAGETGETRGGASRLGLD
jgi:hypothetical protein